MVCLCALLDSACLRQVATAGAVAVGVCPIAEARLASVVQTNRFADLPKEYPAQGAVAVLGVVRQSEVVSAADVTTAAAAEAAAESQAAWEGGGSPFAAAPSPPSAVSRTKRAFFLVRLAPPAMGGPADRPCPSVVALRRRNTDATAAKVEALAAAATAPDASAVLLGAASAQSSWGRGFPRSLLDGPAYEAGQRTSSPSPPPPPPPPAMAPRLPPPLAVAGAVAPSPPPRIRVVPVSDHSSPLLEVGASAKGRRSSFGCGGAGPLHMQGRGRRRWRRVV